MDKKQFLRLRDKYLKGECSEEEKKLMDDFYRSYQEKGEDWEELGLPDNSLVRDELYEAVRSRITEKTITEKAITEKTINAKTITERKHARIVIRESRVAPYMKVAASIALAVVVISTYLLWQGTGQPNGLAMLEKTTQHGQKSTVVLEDGTKISLNSGSRLTYPAQFDKDSREVVLEGEAFFEVTRNTEKPFIVRSGDLVTTVLGTSFNIKAFPTENIAVTVATGKVRVENTNLPQGPTSPQSPQQTNQLSPARDTSSPKNSAKTDKPTFPGASPGTPAFAKASADTSVFAKASADTSIFDKTSADLSAVVLTKAEQAVFNIATNNLTKKTVNINHHLGWKDGVIEFEQTTLAEAILTLERWYNVDLVLDDPALGRCQFSARYKDESLDNVLKSFQYILDLNFRFEDGQRILLEGKGC